MGQMLSDVKKFYNQSNKNTSPQRTEKLALAEKSPGVNKGAHSPSKSLNNNNGFLMTLGKGDSPSRGEDIGGTTENEIKTLTGASDSFAGNHYYTQINDALASRDPLEQAEEEGDQIMSI